MKLIVVRRFSKTSCVTGQSDKVPNPLCMGIYANGEQSRTIHVQQSGVSSSPSLIQRYLIISSFLGHRETLFTFPQRHFSISA